MVGGGPLPKNGDEWHAIRQGRLPYLAGRYSSELHSLLEQMIHPDPMERPSAHDLTQHAVLGPNGAKSKDQLSRELNAERLKNRQLSEKLRLAAQHMQHLMPLSTLFGSDIDEQVMASLAAVSSTASPSLSKCPKLMARQLAPRITVNDEPCKRRLLLGRKMNRSLSNTDF